MSNTKVKSCQNCNSENLRFYNVSFGLMPVKRYAQCLDCAGRMEVKRREPPEHYNQKIEPWDVIEAWGLDFWEGNAIKYICRAGKKKNTPALDDYKKAITYLEYCIEKYSK